MYENLNKLFLFNFIFLKYNETKGGVFWSYNQNIPPFTCKVEEPAKGSKIHGLKSFMQYKIRTEVIIQINKSNY